MGEGVEGVIVDGADCDGLREAVGTTLASKDSDLETCVEEVGEDGWAKIAGSLCDTWRSASLQGPRIGKKGLARGYSEMISCLPLLVRLW